MANSSVVAAVVSRHPLEPLTEDEISAAIRILRQHRALGADTRVCSVTLQEPPKSAGWDGAPAPRQARVISFDRVRGGADHVVGLDDGAIVSTRMIESGQAHLSVGDFLTVITLVRDDPRWQAAMLKRGIEDFGSVQIDPWVTGGFEADGVPVGTRLMRALSYKRTHFGDNGYARPIEGVIAHVDLTREEVIRVDDYGVVPLPPLHGNYDPEHVGPLRRDLKPLEITQPEGPSFAVDGNEIRWQRWQFRVSMHPTQALVLHAVSYDDDGRRRKILHRASLAEMVVPYGDTGPMHSWKSVFDAGEMAIGHLVNSLQLGCDCLGVIHYLDASFAFYDGTAYTVPQAICIHEEDYGILWKHTDLHSGTSQVRRSRRLVVSSIHTVGNYEYGFFWYFYLDGTLQMEVKLTGIMQTSAVPAGTEPECAALVAPQLAAPNHQHLFNFRLDFDVDGEANSVYEVNLEPLPESENPEGNAFAARTTLLGREAEAQRDINAETGRFWLVLNPNVRNGVGKPVGYRLMPMTAPRLLARPHSQVAKRAAFARHNLWVTAFDGGEISAAGDEPNQHPGGAGLPAYAAQNRRLENRDVVVWYSFGVNHVPRPEDWPVMPVEYCGFLLQPYGFFDRNPALDVPPTVEKQCCQE